MKNVLKRNQIMITALAIMIAVAGYLNFAGAQAEEENLTAVSAETEEEDMTALLDLSEEDIAADIESLDTDQDSLAVADYLETDMDTVLLENAEISITGDSAESARMENTDYAAEADPAIPDNEVPGEAVFTSSGAVSSLAGAKLQKEQTRARNKETLLNIINSNAISEEQKTDAVNGMIALTDMAEKETAAEILLEAKGFSDVVVSISGEQVDVVVNSDSLTDAQRAQIEDVVTRKTGVLPENIIISPVKRN